MIASVPLQDPHRSPFALSVLRWLLAAAFMLGGAVLAPSAFAQASIDSLVVKYDAATVPAGVAALPADAEQALRIALGVPFTATGQTRDGAFRLQLADPLDLDTARAALNRVRLDATVLYAGLAPGASVPDTTGRPTDRIIVKFRDTKLIALSKAGLPLDAGRIAQLTSLAGVPVSWLRGAHDGGNVIQMMQRLPIAQVEEIAARIGQDPEVEYAQPDFIRTAQIVPTDPCYAAASVGACGGGYQWDLFDPVGGINMPAAWDLTTGSAAINVSVIDTGALVDHPDLAGRFVGGYDMIADCAVGNDGQPGPCTWSSQTPAFNSRDGDAADTGDWISGAENSGFGSSAPPYNWFQGCRASNSSWHGTHVAGTIGAIPNNGIGISGINWVSKIVPLRVLGKCGGYTSDIADAMVWAAGGSVPGLPANANPARVLSLSLGGGGSCDAASQSAINTALGLGAVVVVAAGNENDNAANHTPASCSGVITVAATNKSGRRSWYSNYGALVEIAAPGGSADGSDSNILSTLNNGATTPNATGYTYANYAGTSMATPHVSGVASLMLSVNPALTPAQVLSKLQTTARAFPTPGPACNSPNPQGSTCNCTTALCGSGILDAGAAVASAIGAATTLQSSANPAATGTIVTFTATVTGVAPTGTVDFKDGGSSIAGCSAVLLGGSGNSRTAQCATAGLAAGTHSIVAAYSGDGGNPSTSSTALSQVVNTPLGTTLVSSQNPATMGTMIALTATVTAKNPAGSISFRDGSVSIGGCAAIALTGAGNTRTAVCNTSSLAPGTHNLIAYYAGDRINAASTSNVVAQVITAGAPDATTTGLTSNLNPSTAGTSVTFTATVNGNAPTGAVDFKDGTHSIVGCSAVTVTGSGNARVAQCATNALAQGTHSITASYGGDAGNLPSASVALSQSVNAAPPTTSTTLIVSSRNPSTFGSSLTLTATINGNAPTGTVDFRDGANSIAGCSAIAVSGAGNGRSAQCTTATLTPGLHSITANYGGDAGNSASSSVTLNQLINAACTGRRC